MAECKVKALQEKERGNAAYKKRQFEEALKHYAAALAFDPTNVAVITNKAAVYFEQEKYDDCIEICNKAIEIGRNIHADYSLIAKAYGRKGNAFMKKNDLNMALTFYNKSLSEHRTSDIIQRAQEVEKMLKEQERLAYINPQISLEKKAEGNKCFQDGNFPDAIKCYDEAIKRNPSDAKIYSNRAACYSKLMEFNLALKDAEECIKLDPSFVKGYLRKGTILMALKEPSKAADAYLKALELDSKCQEAQEGYQKAVIAQGNDPEAVKKRVLNDPEIQKILADPAMQLILQQMQENPDALKEHSKNPAIRTKIEKLLECGIIAIR